MTNQLALNENEIKGIDQSSQTNQINYDNFNQKKTYNRLIIIAPLNLKGKRPPKEFFDYIESIAKLKTYEERTLDNAMQRFDNLEKAEEPTIIKKAEKTLNSIKEANLIKAENKNLDSIVGDYHNSNVNPELNISYNKNGTTLAEPDNLMAHYTTAGANLFNNFGNNLDSKVKNFYNGIRNTKAGAVKKVVLALTTLTLAAVLSTGCGGVTPPPPQKIEIPAGFDKEFFEEICFTWEYGSSEIHNTYRWVNTPKFFLINPTEEQRKIAENKMSELAEFTNYVVVPEIVDDINSSNVTVEWVNLDEIPYGNVAYFTFSHKKGIIYEGEILVYKNLDNILTKRAILEEGGGVLGVTDDSYKYPNSVFYKGANQSTEFAIQDLAVGNVLYQLEPGTTLSEFEEIFENSTKTYSFLDGF